MKMKKEKSCCPAFKPKLWHNKTHIFQHKLFLKESVRTFFYMPLNFNRVMKRLFKTAEKSGAKFQDGLTLTDHTSRWNMDVYVAVNKRIRGAKNVTMSGKFFSRVYEGSNENAKFWAEDFDEYMKSKKLKYSRLYMWYTTCPQCAEEFGKNYVVWIAKID